MAVTLTKLYEDVFGKTRIVGVQVAFDTSYPTGGYGASLGLSAQRIGFNVAGEIYGAQLIGINAAGSGVAMLVWDYTNKKLMAFRVATFTPAGTFTGSALAAHSHVLFVATGATDAAGARVNAATNSFAMNNAAASIAGIAAASGAAGGVVDASGGTPAGTITGTAQGQVAFAQVSNAVNLSAVTCRLEFRGF